MEEENLMPVGQSCFSEAQFYNEDVVIVGPEESEEEDEEIDPVGHDDHDYENYMDTGKYRNRGDLIRPWEVASIMGPLHRHTNTKEPLHFNYEEPIAKQGLLKEEPGTTPPQEVPLDLTVSKHPINGEKDIMFKAEDGDALLTMVEKSKSSLGSFGSDPSSTRTVNEVIVFYEDLTKLEETVAKLTRANEELQRDNLDLQNQNLKLERRISSLEYENSQIILENIDYMMDMEESEAEASIVENKVMKPTKRANSASLSGSSDADNSPSPERKSCNGRTSECTDVESLNPNLKDAKRARLEHKSSTSSTSSSTDTRSLDSGFDSQKKKARPMTSISSNKSMLKSLNLCSKDAKKARVEHKSTSTDARSLNSGYDNQEEKSVSMSSTSSNQSTEDKHETDVKHPIGSPASAPLLVADEDSLIPKQVHDDSTEEKKIEQVGSVTSTLPVEKVETDFQQQQVTDDRNETEKAHSKESTSSLPVDSKIVGNDKEGKELVCLDEFTSSRVPKVDNVSQQHQVTDDAKRTEKENHSESDSKIRAPNVGDGSRDVSKRSIDKEHDGKNETAKHPAAMPTTTNKVTDYKNARSQS